MATSVARRFLGGPRDGQPIEPEHLKNGKLPDRIVVKTARFDEHMNRLGEIEAVYLPTAFGHMRYDPDATP